MPVTFVALLFACCLDIGAGGKPEIAACRARATGLNSRSVPFAVCCLVVSQRSSPQGPGRSQDPTKITRKAGEQLAGFAELRDDGSTQSGCWITAAPGPTGNLMARRDNSDPTGIGQTLNWPGVGPQPSGAVQTRVLRSGR